MKKHDPLNRIKYLLTAWGRWKYAKYAKGIGYSSTSPIANFGMPRTGGVYDTEIPNGTATEVAWLDVVIETLESKEKQVLNCTYAMQMTRAATAELLGYHINTIDNWLKDVTTKLDKMLHEQVQAA